jgi:hypothetical protein
MVEEHDGGRKSGSVLIPEGRHGKGWDLFGSALRLANEHFRAGVRLVGAEPKVQAMRGSRRSYAKVLTKTLPALKESLGVFSGQVTRVPKWVRELSAGVSTDKSVPAPVISKRKVQASAKYTQFPTKVIPVLVKISYPPVKVLTSNCGPALSEKQDVKGGLAFDTLFHFGESLELSNMRETWLKLKEEVGICLMGLDSAVDGLLGREHKLSSHQAQPNHGVKIHLEATHQCL